MDRKPKRETVRCGVKCDVCQRIDWLIYAGHNRCECGQYLWIVRTAEPHVVRRTGKTEMATRFRYHQGLTLPDGYRGWDQVTR
jgi:hypothetical protein